MLSFYLQSTERGKIFTSSGCYRVANRYCDGDQKDTAEVVLNTINIDTE